MELWMLRGRSWTRGLYIVARRTSPACLLTYFVAGAVSIADPKGFRGDEFWTAQNVHLDSRLTTLITNISTEPPATMSLTCTKRLRKEMHKLRTSPPDEDIALHADDDDIRKWTAHIRGPPDTPYEGGVYELKIAVSSSYPMVPPSMYFATKVFHPNVHFNTGEICLNILKKEWSPAWSLQGACRAILALLAHPEADSPLNCDAGNMVRAGDVRAFRSVARLYKEELASKEWPPK